MATKTKKKTKAKRLKPNEKLIEAKKHIHDVDSDLKYFKACIYARNGKGKTYFASTGPKPIIIDCNEQGTPSIRNVKGVKIFEVNTWTDIDLAYWYCKAGKHDRETVIIDTVTALERLCMKFILGDEASRDPTRDPDVASKREYGKRRELMENMILQFRNLNMNVVFLAQEQRTYQEEDADDEPPEIGPALGGKARQAMMDSVNIIGRMYTKSVVTKKKVKGKTKKVVTPEFRMLLTNDHDLYISKVNIQDHGLPRVMKNPTIPKIMARINKKEVA